jgi:quercetin dioxygenase-like cupin family protein
VPATLLEVVEYRVAPDEDLGGWFESDGEMTVYVIDGEIEVRLENEGSWRLGAGEAISHPADIRHRWAVVGDGGPGSSSRSRTRTQPLGPFRYRRLTAKPVTRFMM